jgi:hypothetical protein
LETQTASKSPAHHTSKELADLVNTKHVISSVSLGGKISSFGFRKGIPILQITYFSFKKMTQRSAATYAWKNVLKPPDLDYRF